jgi:hypothetical protein
MYRQRAHGRGVICVVSVLAATGRVRVRSDPGQPGPDLVIDVAELIWEPIAD